MAILVMVALPQPVLGGLLIEEAQRELQARCKWTIGEVHWMPCPCGTSAPFYPPDKFYGDLDHDPQLAFQLVKDLANTFNNVYGSYLNTDGSSGIEGASTYPVISYQSADFPLDTVTINNYTNVFRILRGYIERLQYINLESLLWWYDDGHGNTLIIHQGASSAEDWHSCDEAQGSASANWGPRTDWNFNYYPPIGVEDYSTGTPSYDPVSYNAFLQGFVPRLVETRLAERFITRLCS